MEEPMCTIPCDHFTKLSVNLAKKIYVFRHGLHLLLTTASQTVAQPSLEILDTIQNSLQPLVSTLDAIYDSSFPGNIAFIQVEDQQFAKQYLFGEIVWKTLTIDNHKFINAFEAGETQNGLIILVLVLLQMIIQDCHIYMPPVYHVLYYDIDTEVLSELRADLSEILDLLRRKSNDLSSILWTRIQNIQTRFKKRRRQPTRS